MARKRLVTVEEAILLHLLDYSRYSPGDTVPIGLAQAGMAMALGVRRSHISISLDSAKTKGLVEEHLAHVKGQSRRRKCYFITQGGKEQAKEVDERIGSETVSAVLPDGREFNGGMGELAQKSGIPLPRLALLAQDGTVRLPAPEPRVFRDSIPEVGCFVGRQEELSRLGEFFDGDADLLFLSGMPGIGKTALAARAAAGRDLFWFDITDWSSPRNLSNNLAGYLSSRGFNRMLRYLEAHEVPDVADIGDILMGVGFPLTMVFDDCQKAGNSLAEFLRMLVSVCSGSELLKAGFLAREMPDIMDMKLKLAPDNIVQIALGPLGQEDSALLLEGRGIDGPGLQRILEQAGGHPLYLTLAGEGGGEGSLEDILSRMIYQGLEERENRLLHLLSVFRQPVSADALVEETEDIAILEGLERKCMVFNAGGWSMHNLIREFYYARQSPDDRKGCHELAAEHYGAHTAGPGGQIEETYHLLRSGDMETGILNFIIRGHDWLRGGYVDEILLLADMIPDDWHNPEEAFQIDFLIAAAFDLTGEWDNASEHYGLCFEAAVGLNDIARQASVLRRQGAILYRRGEMDDARELLEKALLTLGEAGGRELLARIHGSLGVVYWRMGDARRAREAYGRDLDISSAERDREGMARALNNLGILDWEAGDLGAALERYSEALELAEALGDKKLVAILYSNIADVHRSKGEAAGARRYYERCLELAEDLKFNWQVAEAHRGLAQVTDEKEKHLRRALAIFQRLGAEEDAKSVISMMD